MNNTEESKTYFSQWLSLALLFGLIAVLMFGLFLKTVFYPNQQNRPMYEILIGPAILSVLWTIFHWEIRFERDQATIFYCFFFPVQIQYTDVAEIGYICNELLHPDAPTRIIFILKSGKKKQWNLALFTPTIRLEIMRELNNRTGAVPYKS